ncbi:MAG: hypothetical protein LCH30_03175 [Proteobacteria bacterium]|nr:hypothetical protein [Pseudomonadota bacterium]
MSLDIATVLEVFSSAKLDSRSETKLAKSDDLDPFLCQYKAALMAKGNSEYFLQNQDVSEPTFSSFFSRSDHNPCHPSTTLSSSDGGVIPCPNH